MKSNVSDYLKLVDCIYRDATTMCTADVSDLRDLMTIRSRVESEGVSFLTITLPQFCNDFERSLANGGIDSKCFAGFAKHQAIPAFLQGMLSRIFDRETGEIIDDSLNSSPHGQDRRSAEDVSTIIAGVRQICLTFKKIELECSPARTNTAFRNYIETEHSFDAFHPEEDEVKSFLVLSSVLWDNAVADFSASACSPKHGPGATAEKLSGNGKFRWQRWHNRLESYFPLIGNGYPLGAFPDSEELHSVTIVQEADEQPVRVVAVPKTLKGPRIIAIEPVCMQFVQQGIRDYLYDKLETYWLTAGHINFRDQSINQKLAIISSSDGQYSTIDLSDASDRVPLSLAMKMLKGDVRLPNYRELHDSVLACRSTRAVLPDGRLVDPLKKFASMGSALCFPIEAMYFYTICVMAVLDQQNLSYTPLNVFKASRGVYVYGDDIIVPTTYAVTVLRYLQKYNCKVNTNKTFVSGRFRESCGIDAYQGYEVTPTYIRQEAPRNRRDATETISWTATANLFYKKGYWQTCEYMFSVLERLWGPFPYVSDESSGLGRFSYLGYRSVERWNPELQRFEIKALVPKPIYRTDRLDGYGALAASLSNLDRTRPNQISEGISLEHTVLRGAAALKRRWVLP